MLIWVSVIGVPLFVAAVTRKWWRRGDRDHTPHALVATGLSLVLGLAINQLNRRVVHRIGPYDAGISPQLIAPSADPAFPTDHATATFALAAAFLFYGMRRFVLWFLAAALLVSVSRDYTGKVLRGASMGTVAAIAVRALYWEERDWTV